MSEKLEMMISEIRGMLARHMSNDAVSAVLCHVRDLAESARCEGYCCGYDECNASWEEGPLDQDTY